MRIKIISDLHLEFSYTEIPNTELADVLILSGDIVVAEYLHQHNKIYPHVIDSDDFDQLSRKQKSAAYFRKFFDHCSQQYKHVIYVAGNHEFYDGKFFKAIEYLKAEIALYPNIYFLENNTEVIDNVAFIGATIWTDLNRRDPLTLFGVERAITDYKAIRNDKQGYRPLTAADTVHRHSKSVEYIKSAAAEHQNLTCVVVGHHSPCFKSVPEQFADDHVINGAYHSDLTDIMLDYPQIKLWTHGHIHSTADYHIGECRVVCNPRGYQSDTWQESTGFDPSKIVEL